MTIIHVWIATDLTATLRCIMVNLVVGDGSPTLWLSFRSCPSSHPHDDHGRSNPARNLLSLIKGLSGPFSFLEPLMSTSALIPAPTDNAPPALVVYGLDESGKPHASLFAATDVDLAEKAAGLMSMCAFRLTEPDHLTTVAGLPQGRVFASGKAFVPFVKRALYDRLTALGGAPEPKPMSRPADPPARSAKTKVADGAELTNVEGEKADGDEPAPADASEKQSDPLAPGTVVLAPEVGASWWEAVVVAVKSESVTLKWRDFPAERSFQRKRNQIAALPDGYVPPV